MTTTLTTKERCTFQAHWGTRHLGRTLKSASKLERLHLQSYMGKLKILPAGNHQFVLLKINLSLSLDCNSLGAADCCQLVTRFKIANLVNMLCCVGALKAQMIWFIGHCSTTVVLTNKVRQLNNFSVRRGQPQHGESTLQSTLAL